MSVITTSSARHGVHGHVPMRTSPGAAMPTAISHGRVRLMHRRAFLAGSVTLFSSRAYAQTSGAIRIGILGATRAEDLPSLEGLRRGLHERGYVEGQNLAVEYRWAEGRFERLPQLAAELVTLKPAVIVALVTQASLAAREATSSIPIVMVAVGDPIGSGLVTSLGRPGGNVTGNSSASVEVAGKSVEILKEIAGDRRRVAILWNPANSVFQSQMLKEAEAASRRLGLQAHVVAARNTSEIDTAFQAMSRARAEAVAILSDPIFVRERQRIAALAAKGRLPSIGGIREYADAGGLVGYGPNFYELYRGAAAYVERILKGAKPAELPVEQPTRFELTVNLKTAKALGITIPPSLLLRADQLIEQ
jgi:putative tryptophan/tyrosine transport system substrate-binding protein